MKQIVEKYPNDVRWIYRHFPLDSLHSKARKEAEATECAAELGGEEKFWAYLDRLFEVTPSNDRLDLAELPNIASAVGLNRAKFEECLGSGRHAGRVAAQLLDAANAGGDGTPYTIFVSANGEKLPLSGALPFEKIAAIIDGALQAE
jgi:protein-disulfide isomerase